MSGYWNGYSTIHLAKVTSMHKTARILAILMAFSLVTPVHSFTIEDRTWHTLTGLGAIGGAAIGTWISKKRTSANSSTKPGNEQPNTQDKNAKTQTKSRLETIKSYLPAFGSGALGAFIGGLVLRKIFWSSSLTGRNALEESRIAHEQATQLAQEQARLALLRAREEQAQNSLIQAQELIGQASTIDRLLAFLMDGIDGKAIEEQARRNFDGYPLVYAGRSMLNAEQRLLNAQKLCNSALVDANGNQELIQNCTNTLEQIEQHIHIARKTGAEIRANPSYDAQVQNELQARIAQQNAAAEQQRAQATLNAANAAIEQAYAAQQQAQADMQKARATESLAFSNHQKAQAEREHARATDRLAAATQQKAYAEQERARAEQQRAQAEERTARATEQMAAAAQQQMHATQHLALNSAKAPKKSSSRHHHSSKKK